MDDGRIEKLEKDLEAFRKDFGEISHTLRKIAEDKSNELGNRARGTYQRLSNHAQDLWENAQDYGKDYYDRARDSLDDTLYQTKEKVRNNPLQAVAIVAGVSFIIGFLTSRR